jgi:hypothetical protein
MQNKQWVRLLGLVAATGLTVAWGQRGAGARMGGGNASMGAGSASQAASSHRNSGSKAGSSSSGTAVSKANAKSTAAGGSIADRVTANSGLDSKVQALLPSGMTLQNATAGFKNMGQFVAALHVSHNLNIPFDQLQKEVAGGKSLGQAIETLRPNTTKSAAKAAVKEAEAQAKQDTVESKKQS